MTALDILTAHAAATPDKAAVVDGDTGVATRFAELEAAANRLASGLLARGLAPGERLVWCGPNSPAVLVVLHGARKAGLVAVPLAYRFTADEMRYVIGDSGARIVLVDPEQAATVRDAGPDCPVVVFGGPEWDDLLASGSPVPSPPPPTGARQMIYTSGTTGKPKGALRGGPDPTTTAALVTALRMRPGEEVHLATGPLYHSGPLAWATLTHLLGGTVVVTRAFDPVRWLDLVREHRVTNTFTAPTPLKRVVALPPEVLARADLGSMRSLTVNAAPMPYALKQEVVRTLGDGFLFEVYGSTELGVNTVLLPEDQLRKPGSCGRALPGVDLRVVAADGSAAPPGEPGELQVRSASTFAGYHGQGPAGDAEGWKSVGDVAYLDDEGYLHICDRGGDLVISGGMNVYPAEVEAVLHEHPDVLDAAVVGLPSDEWGESVHAVVVPRPDRALDVAALEAHVAERLAGYKRPRSWEVRDELPRTDSGKLLRRRLRPVSA